LSFTYWLDLSATIPYNTPQTAGVGNYYIMGTNPGTGCYSIAGPVVVSMGPTGIPDELTDNLVIYSYNNTIFIKNCKPNSQVLIYNAIGGLLYNELSTSEPEIITTELQPGIYIVKVVTDKEVKSQKVYIQ
jgi:hypothetical protein